MLKITDKPKYEDFENTMEIMAMFKHAIHSDFALEWISGALAYIDTQRVNIESLHKAINMWFSDNDGDRESFEELYNHVHKLTTLADILRFRKEINSDDSI